MKASITTEAPHIRYRAASTKPPLPDFDIVIVVLHRGYFEWMERQKNTSATTIGRLPWEDFVETLRTIVIRMPMSRALRKPL
jgi:hypothetical protein